MKRFISSFSVCLLLLFMFQYVEGQDVGAKTLISQSRTTTANIGKADISIKYHSPMVNGRKIFGGIVPYDFKVDGKEYPWRTGSNQRTTISFSHDVKINGKPLAAGEYGFLALVSQKEWTLIFSSGKSWGAFNYSSENDVLRIPVTPQKSSFQEWLSYDFNNPQVESVEVELKWEETSISFEISTDASANILSDLTNKETKSANDYQSLALLSLDRDSSKVDEALAFVEQSLEELPNIEQEGLRKAYEFSGKMLKADLLISKGEKKKGTKLKQEMLEAAGGFNMYYYALRKYTVEGKKEEAFQLLTEATKTHPNNFQNHMALGEYYLKENNQAKATAHFQKAYEMTLEQENRWLNYAHYLYLQNKLVLESQVSR